MDDLEKQLNESTAVIYFGMTFAEYVKEVDPVLWKRAREFAMDYCEKLNDVELTLVDPEDKE